MIWIEIVCDSCNNNPYGEVYRSGSVQKIKETAKQNGWKTIKGKIYCPDCIARMTQQTTSNKQYNKEN